ncbi:MAG: ABC transporter permease [Thermotogota bacterium]
MYLRFVMRRLFWGVFSFVCIIFMYSCVLNAKVEATAWADVVGVVQGFMQTEAAKNIPEDELPAARKQVEQNAIKMFGLDRPIILRILELTKDSLLFNFGETSFQEKSGKRKISSVVWDASKKSLLLFVTSSAICFWLGLVFGKLKAVHNGSFFDKITTVFTMIFFGTPAWWMANIFLYFLVYQQRIFPFGVFHSTPVPTGLIPYVLDSLYYLRLPIFTLLIVGFWGTAYLVRNILLKNLGEDYIMSARARGIPERKVIHDHALRTAAPPIVTMGLLSLATAFAGNIIIEIVFSYHGLGMLLWQAIQTNRIKIMMASLVAITLIYCAALIILDLIYGFLDPRINYNAK